MAQDKAQRKAQNKCNAYKAVLDWYTRNQPKDKVGKFLGPLRDRPAKHVKIYNIYMCSDKILCVF